MKGFDFLFFYLGQNIVFVPNIYMSFVFFPKL
jgi:hypothetical protein